MPTVAVDPRLGLRGSIPPDPQLMTSSGAKNRGGQYRLRQLRAMHLRRVAYVLEP